MRCLPPPSPWRRGWRHESRWEQGSRPHYNPWWTAFRSGIRVAASHPRPGPPMDDLLEQTISHYRIVSLLGAGGMLIDEARTASSLSHPHIAVIYDVGEDRGHLFFAMELVEGKSLREIIPRGGLPLSTVCEYGAQIASALAFAHQQGIVHRDLKTANVMITPDG